MKASSVVRLKLRVRLPDGSRPYLNPVFSGNKRSSLDTPCSTVPPFTSRMASTISAIFKGTRRVWGGRGLGCRVRQHRQAEA
jgi:hypothetical protein